jgi:hypothetical protein
VKLQPVIDPQDTPPVDGYEIPRRIREAMFLRMPDLDHTKSYQPLARGGPPGQTGVHALGPRDPLRTPHQNPQQMAGTTTRTRHLDLAITQPRPLPGQQHRNPQPRQRRLRTPNMARSYAGKTASHHHHLVATRPGHALSGSSSPGRRLMRLARPRGHQRRPPRRTVQDHLHLRRGRQA